MHISMSRFGTERVNDGEASSLDWIVFKQGRAPNVEAFDEKRRADFESEARGDLIQQHGAGLSFDTGFEAILRRRVDDMEASYRDGFLEYSPKPTMVRA